MKYLRLKLSAPELFTGKIIEHNGFTIEFNRDYKGEAPEGLAKAMKELQEATKNPCHPTRIFNALIIEDNIDLDNLPYVNDTDEDSNIWFNVRDLGFTIQTKLGFRDEWKDTQMIGRGWEYRINPECTLTLDDIRKA